MKSNNEADQRKTVHTEVNQSSEGEPTMWEEFRAKQEAKARPGIHELLIKSTVEWIIYCIVTLYIIGTNEVTYLLLPVLISIRLLTLGAWVYSIVRTAPRQSKSYIGATTFVMGLITALHFSEGMAVDLVSESFQLECWRNTDNVACMVASRSFGPHQTAVMVTILATARLMVIKKLNYVFLLSGVVVACAILATLEFCLLGSVSFQTSLTEADYYRAILPIAILGFLNSYGLSVWEQEAWEGFVQRKRLQLSCIRAEELLTLVMPRDIAHELMQGQVVPKHVPKASLGFLYISRYKEYLESSSTNTIEFVSYLHELYSELDRLVLLHPEVYKVESVGDCYFVGSNVPWNSDNHAKAILAFSFDALIVCQTLHQKHGNPRTTPSRPWELKIGLHSGPVTGGCCGKTRNFFRIFGDTVNVTSRLGSTALPNSLHLSEEFLSEIGSPVTGSTLQVSGPHKCVNISHVQRTYLKGKGEMKTYVARALNLDSKDAILLDSKLKHEELPTQGCTPDPEESEDTEEQSDQGIQYDNEKHQPTASASVSQKKSDQDIKPKAAQQRTDCNLLSNVTQRPARVDPSVKLKEYRAFPFIEHENTTTASLLDPDGTKNGSKFQRTQKIVNDATKLLDVPFSTALDAYRNMRDRQVRKKDLYYIKEVQHYYLKRFFNIFPSSLSTVPHLQRGNSAHCLDTAATNVKTQKTLVDHTGNEDPVWGSMSHIFRVVKFASLRFQTPELERFYQVTVTKSLFDVTYMTLGRFMSILVASLAVYFPGLVHTPFTFVACNLGIAILIMGSYELVRQFHSMKTSFHSLQCEGEPPEFLLRAALKSDQQTETRRSNNSHPGPRGTSSTFDSAGLIDWKNVAPLFRLRTDFSPWLTIFSFFVTVIFSWMDQIALKSLHSHYDRPDLCVASLLPLQLIFSIFQIFPTSARRRAANACAALFGYITVSLTTGTLHGSNVSLCFHGMYMLFIIASNGFVESAFKELRFRQRFIARLAATNAQKHSNDALVRLFPQTVVNRLERDEPVPFETHSNDVIILWADISGFTKLCSDLPAPEVKRILDSLYSVLDHHVEQEQLWKMDTIGDAYVVIGGLNEEDRCPIIERMFRIGTEIQTTFDQLRKRTGYNIAIRVGIHAGPVVSGIIGALRPRFYIFGKTVLEAESLESTCEPGKIQASQRIADLYWNSRYSLIERSSQTTNTFWVEKPEN